jgi:hypothetical protein
MLNVEQIRALPFVLKVALVGSLGLFVFDVLFFAGLIVSGAAKIDPGLATLIGAIIGLSVVAWQTREGFQNLIRSQQNQAELDREARLHRFELDERARAVEWIKEVETLRASLRAEMIHLHRLAQEAETLSLHLKEKYLEHAQAGAAPTIDKVPMESFDAPIFRSHLSKIGLLGPSLAADVVIVLSVADGKSQDFESTSPLTMEFIANTLYARHALKMKHWQEDLFHVAMRIRAVEEGTPDPGTLSATSVARRRHNRATAKHSLFRVEGRDSKIITLRA